MPEFSRFVTVGNEKLDLYISVYFLKVEQNCRKRMISVSLKRDTGINLSSTTCISCSTFCGLGLIAAIVLQFVPLVCGFP